MEELRISRNLSPVKKAIHVLFVAGCWYPDAKNPVQGIFIRRHAEAVARKHQVTVLHPFSEPSASSKPEISWNKNGEVCELNVRFRGRPSQLGGRFRSQIGFFRAGLIGCKAIRRKGRQPDIIHIHVVPSVGLVAAIMLVFPGIPVVVTEHWTGYHPETRSGLGLLRRLYTSRLIRYAHAVTTVSENLRDVMLGHGFQGHYFVVPNVVDTEVFTPNKERKPGPVRFVVVAALRPVKRIPSIIEVVSRLLDAGTDLELHILGDGQDRAAAEKVAEELGWLNRRVYFHGEQNQAEVAQHLRSCDCLLLFSDFENSPCVIGEAMACGLPVVATRIAGIPEQVTSERGILVEKGDEKSFAQALASVCHDLNRFDSQAIRKYAEQTFSPDVIEQEFTEIYRTLLSHSRLNKES